MPIKILLILINSGTNTVPVAIRYCVELPNIYYPCLRFCGNWNPLFKAAVVVMMVQSVSALLFLAFFCATYGFKAPRIAKWGRYSTICIAATTREIADVATSSRAFVGNLPFTITEAELSSLVSKLVGPGLVKEIKIAKGQKTQRPLGFAFVDMIDASAAEKAVGLLNGYDWDGRVLNSNIKPIEEGSQSADKKKKKNVFDESKSIFLRNVDPSLTEDEIFNMCDDLVGEGLAKKVKIILDKETKQPRGFVHVEFKDESAVDIAIKELTNVEVYGRLLRAERMVPSTRMTMF